MADCVRKLPRPSPYRPTACPHTHGFTPCGDAALDRVGAPFVKAKMQLGRGQACSGFNTVPLEARDARQQRRGSVQKLHSETALITPYNGAINIQASTWNAQPKCRGHERRVIDLDDRRGIREVADLAPHKTAVDQYLRSIDAKSPLVRHVSQSPRSTAGEILEELLKDGARTLPRWQFESLDIAALSNLARLASTPSEPPALRAGGALRCEAEAPNHTLPGLPGSELAISFSPPTTRSSSRAFASFS